MTEVAACVDLVVMCNSYEVHPCLTGLIDTVYEENLNYGSAIGSWGHPQTYDSCNMTSSVVRMTCDVNVLCQCFLHSCFTMVP